jgi:hypothetical protein
VTVGVLQFVYCVIGGNYVSRFSYCLRVVLCCSLEAGSRRVVDGCG